MTTTNEAIMEPHPNAVRLPSVHDFLAVMAFIMAWFFPPIGFIMGWVSITTAHRDGYRESGLSVAAMLISVVILIVYVVIIVNVFKTPALPCDINNPNYPACLWMTKNSSGRCDSSTDMPPLTITCSWMARYSGAAESAGYGRSLPRQATSCGAIHVLMNA